MRPWAAAVAVAGSVALIWAVVLGGSRIRRLDRLHVRMDAARDGLAAALHRRWDAAERAADAAWSAAGPDAPRAAEARSAVRTAVAAARRPSGAPDREAAENALSRALGSLDRVPWAAAAELAEAEQLLGLARRVHNDAVRDTLALRARRLVRWLRLAGTAPMPAYFEIAAVEVTGTAPPTRAAGPAR